MQSNSRRRKILLATGYIIAAILLDLASGYFVLQTGLAICYPPAGLYLGAILLLGWRALPLAFLNPFFSILVTLADPSIPLITALAIGVVSMISPAIILGLTRMILNRSATNGSAPPTSHASQPAPRLKLEGLTQVILFIAVVILAVAVESLAAALVYVASGLTQTQAYVEIAVGWWISNVIPMLTITPMILLAFRPKAELDHAAELNPAAKLSPANSPRHSDSPSIHWHGWTGALPVLVAVFSVCAIWLALVPSASGYNSRLYIGLLPILVGALGGGLYGATWAALWVTGSILVLSPAYLVTPQAIIEAQFFLLAATISGLVTGALVTDRRSVERELRQSEQRFRLLAENSTDMVSQHTLDGIYTYASLSSRALLGCEPEELVSHSAYEFLHPEDLPIIHQSHDLSIQSGQANSAVYRMRRKDGDYIWVETTSHSVVDPASGKLIGLTCSTRDISTRKRAEDDLQRLNASLEQRIAERTTQLEAKNRELETFAYSVSHDLKAPLRGIDGYSRLLMEDYHDHLNDEGLFYLENVRSAAGRMNQLIGDLLQYARLESRQVVKTKINLAVLFDKLLEAYQPEIEARQAIVTVESSCEEVTVEVEGLEQALRNLLDNALKFSQRADPPRIELGCRPGNSSVLIWVRDNGIGFDMEYHERIFEIFQRLNRAEDYPGTGIGLALVRKVMERLGGKAWAQSAPGQGAVFFLEFPQ